MYLINLCYVSELCQDWEETNRQDRPSLSTILEVKLQDHGPSIKGSDADQYKLLELLTLFPPENRMCVPVYASSFVKNPAPVLSMNGELGQESFSLSIPQAKLVNTHGAYFLFLQELLPTTGLAVLSRLLSWGHGELCSDVYYYRVKIQRCVNFETQRGPLRPSSPTPVVFQPFMGERPPWESVAPLDFLYPKNKNKKQKNIHISVHNFPYLSRSFLHSSCNNTLEFQRPHVKCPTLYKCPCECQYPYTVSELGGPVGWNPQEMSCLSNSSSDPSSVLRWDSYLQNMETLCSVAKDRLSKASQLTHLRVCNEDNAKAPKEVVGSGGAGRDQPGGCQDCCPLVM